MPSLPEMFSQHRPKLARLVALGGVAAMASVLVPNVPRPVAVDLMLGPAHQDFVEVRVAYVEQGEEVHGVAFSFPGGAPEHVRHEVSLPAGDFELRAELRRADGRALASIRKLHAPTNQTVRISLAESAR